MSRVALIAALALTAACSTGSQPGPLGDAFPNSDGATATPSGDDPADDGLEIEPDYAAQGIRFLVDAFRLGDALFVQGFTSVYDLDRDADAVAAIEDSRIDDGSTSCRTSAYSGGVDPFFLVRTQEDRGDVWARLDDASGNQLTSFNLFFDADTDLYTQGSAELDALPDTLMVEHDGQAFTLDAPAGVVDGPESLELDLGAPPPTLSFTLDRPGLAWFTFEYFTPDEILRVQCVTETDGAVSFPFPQEALDVLEGLELNAGGVSAGFGAVSMTGGLDEFDVEGLRQTALSGHSTSVEARTFEPLVVNVVP